MHHPAKVGSYTSNMRRVGAPVTMPASPCAKTRMHKGSGRPECMVSAGHHRPRPPSIWTTLRTQRWIRRVSVSKADRRDQLEHLRGPVCDCSVHCSASDGL